jgi:uncharacterized membrane protein YeaQ/YmgE (transglycosylase-associated protein family)
MHILLFLLFGLIVGVVARFLVPGRESGGWVLSIVLGIAGAYLGGFIGKALGFSTSGQLSGFVFAVLGAVLLLVGYHAVRGTRAAA